MNHVFPCFLLTTYLLARAGSAQAQPTFSIGPHIGLNRSGASYLSDFHRPSFRMGGEVGVLSSVQLGHVSLQPALLFSQKGYYLTSGTDQNTGINHDIFRLNYLALPVKVVYARKDRQGLQVLAGAYLALLVGGATSGPSPFTVAQR